MPFILITLINAAACKQQPLKKSFVFFLCTVKNHITVFSKRLI